MDHRNVSACTFDAEKSSSPPPAPPGFLYFLRPYRFIHLPLYYHRDWCSAQSPRGDARQVRGNVAAMERSYRGRSKIKLSARGTPSCRGKDPFPAGLSPASLCWRPSPPLEKMLIRDPRPIGRVKASFGLNILGLLCEGNQSMDASRPLWALILWS